MIDKYEQLKNNLKHLTERYEQGILTGTLDGARLAISDLQADIESLKAITELKNAEIEKLQGVIDDMEMQMIIDIEQEELH